MNAICSVFAALGNLATSINGMVSDLVVETVAFASNSLSMANQRQSWSSNPLTIPMIPRLPKAGRPKPEAHDFEDAWERQQGGGFAPPCSFERNVSDAVRLCAGSRILPIESRLTDGVLPKIATC